MLCVCVDEKERRGRVLFSQEMVLAWSRTLLAPSQTPNRTPMRRVNHVIGLTQPSSFNVPTHASTPWRQSIIALVQSCPRSKRERVVLADLRTIPPSLVSFKPLHTLALRNTTRTPPSLPRDRTHRRLSTPCRVLSRFHRYVRVVVVVVLLSLRVGGGTLGHTAPINPFLPLCDASECLLHPRSLTLAYALPQRTLASIA